MKCLSPITLDAGTFGCGQCMNCRINKSRSWTARLLMELQLWPQHSCFFATFTYDDEHVPTLPTGEQTLVREHGRKLRKDLHNTLGYQPRFFWVGEYGEKFSRPHYHAIFFGLNLPDPTALLGKLWSQGFTTVGYVNPTRAAYIAQYTTKKITGDRSTAHYGPRHPEYSQMSRRPALGDHWIRRISDWLKTPAGEAYLNANIDVPSSFRYDGAVWPIGNRHRRMLRRLVGLPELLVDVYDGLPPIDPPPTPEELQHLEHVSKARVARSAIFRSGSAVVGVPRSRRQQSHRL